MTFSQAENNYYFPAYRAISDAFVTAGGNFFGTAHFDSDGLNKQIVGDLIAIIFLVV